MLKFKFTKNECIFNEWLKKRKKCLEFYRCEGCIFRCNLEYLVSKLQRQLIISKEGKGDD